MNETIFLLYLVHDRVHENSDSIVLGAYTALETAKEAATHYPITRNEYFYIEEKSLDNSLNRVTNDENDYHLVDISYFNENNIY